MEIQLNPIQNEIKNAILQLSEKESFTEAILAKKIRQNLKLDGKKKAGLSLEDLLKIVENLNKEEIFYSIHINSVNDILLKKENHICELSEEQKHRRLASEKSMVIFTNSDLKSPANKKNIQKKRNERKTLNLTKNWEDEF